MNPSLPFAIIVLSAGFLFAREPIRGFHNGRTRK
jgi:hypothetical protein